MKILVVSALRIEIAPFLLKSESLNIKNAFADERNFFLYTGIGMEKTYESLGEFLEKYRVDHLLNIGFCGALRDNFAFGKVLQVKDVCLPHSRKRIFDLKIPSNELKSVRCCTVQSPVDSDSERKRIFLQSSAEIVDMELYAVAEISQRKGIPLSSVKIISDYARSNVHGQVKSSAKFLSEKLYSQADKLLSVLGSI